MWFDEPFLAPQFPRNMTWINSEPFFLNQRRGVWCILFWDYTDVPCIRTIPYLIEWHRRYQDKGLIVVGIHTPRFRFARQRHQVDWAIKKLGIEFPVALDNYSLLWRMYHNDCWPTQFLIDARGWVRYTNLGEVRHGEVETAIQLLLRELDPSIDLPPIMRLSWFRNEPDTLSHPTTPDLYTGYELGRFGDLDGYVYDHTVIYEDSGKRDEGVLYAQGQWHTASDYLAFMGERGHLAFIYQAMGVNAILSPTWDEIVLMLGLNSGQVPQVGIWLDSGPVPHTDAGADIAYGRNRGSFIVVDRPRSFNLIRHPSFGRHELRLSFSHRDVAAYAFSFLSFAETYHKRS